MYVCIQCAHIVQGSQKKASDSLKSELQMVVVGIKPRFSWGAGSAQPAVSDRTYPDKSQPVCNRDLHSCSSAVAWNRSQ